MYLAPEQYGCSDYVYEVNDADIATCMMHTVMYQYTPCDEDVYQLCCEIMRQNNLQFDSSDTWELTRLYIILRSVLHNML